MQPIEFVGFAADCTISGKLTMFGDRLTDFLNGQERFRVHHLEFESLEDGHTVALDSISIERTDLLAVVGTGPRGDEKRRVPVETNRIHVSIGPYLILGRLHAEPGLDPVESVLHREPMLPLTDVTIAYEVAGTIVARDVSTIIVNRPLVDWISPTTDAATLFPEIPVRSPFANRLQKDMTGGPSPAGLPA